ncbi:unnamed protein product [Parnassius apollo]|uniref:(apollo) hypothetical protein n=1 Tax=Parnassius apollo TaxID=110799 RepID=A0A8S3XUP0_PARAO|nr:unnamed protein product [Parnassius apollo]
MYECRTLIHTDTGLFGKFRMAQVYSMKNQRARFMEILGDKMDRRYITRNQFLTRGHLAPRVDFTLGALQRASFHYINTAPQWLRGNAGDWAALEDAVRRRAYRNGSRLVVYTGTYGVCTLADAHNEQQELFLNVDDNNNGVVPVPLYYYKLRNVVSETWIITNVIIQFWTEVKKYKDAGGNNPFQELAELDLHVLVLPHSNVDIKRIFR